MNNSDFDDIFDEAFDRVAARLPEIELDPNDAWEKVQARMATLQKGKRRKKQVIRYCVIAASILICFFLIGRNEIVRAFTPIYQSITQAGEEMISFFFGNDEKSSRGAKTSPPNQNENPVVLKPDNLISITIDVREAEKRITFSLPYFTVPERFQLKSTKIFVQSEDEPMQSNEIRFSYIDNDNKILRIEIKKLLEDSNIGSGASRKGTTIKKIPIKSGTAYLTLSEDGSSKVEFLRGDIYFLIIGELPEDEIVQLVQSIS